MCVIETLGTVVSMSHLFVSLATSYVTPVIRAMTELSQVALAVALILILILAAGSHIV